MHAHSFTAYGDRTFNIASPKKGAKVGEHRGIRTVPINQPDTKPGGCARQRE